MTSLFYVNSAFKETQKWMDFHPAKGYSWKSSKSPSTTTTATASSSSTTTAMTTDKTKSGSQQQQQQQQVVVGGGGTLRARENQEFRHWMDRAIEASALRIAQNRFVPEQTVVANTPEVGSLTSVATVSFLLFEKLFVAVIFFLLLLLLLIMIPFFKIFYSHHNIRIEVKKTPPIIFY